MITDQNSSLVLLANQVVPLHTLVIERPYVLGCSRMEAPYPYLFWPGWNLKLFESIIFRNEFWEGGSGAF